MASAHSSHQGSIVPFRAETNDSEAATEALDRLFEAMGSVHQRFGYGLDGLVLFEKVKRAYKVSEGKVVLPYYDAAGRKALARHPVNDRMQASTLRKYKDQVLRHEVVQGVRGEPWIVDANAGEPKWLLTYGTLTNAIYLANEEMPSNAQVVMTLNQGLRDCLIFRKDTPLDVLRWLRDYHNRFHQGAAQSFTELLDEVLVVEGAWQVYKDQIGKMPELCGMCNYTGVCGRWFVSCLHGV